MIPGLNTDVRYKGKTFHIQTEDSGLENPLLITHVFLGGTILGSEKSSYEEILGGEDVEGQVRELMRTQHRGMYRALLDGQYDDLARRPTVARRPEGRAIPLATRTPGMGVVGGRASLVSNAPAPAEGTVEGPPSRPTVVQREEPKVDTQADTEDVSQAGLELSRPDRLPFPTDLTGGRRLPDVMLAYLLEDPEEG